MDPTTPGPRSTRRRRRRTRPRVRHARARAGAERERPLRVGVDELVHRELLAAQLARIGQDAERQALLVGDLHVVGADGITAARHPAHVHAAGGERVFAGEGVGEARDQQERAVLAELKGVLVDRAPDADHVLDRADGPGRMGRRGLGVNAGGEESESYGHGGDASHCSSSTAGRPASTTSVPGMPSSETGSPSNAVVRTLITSPLWGPDTIVNSTRTAALSRLASTSTTMTSYAPSSSLSASRAFMWP